ncbi:MAG TPA: type II toxin-antitoxin system prevent-host-death family antitoxin [Acidobacteriota bacterium]|jgi:prevent-host-death family protein
MKTVNVHEAKTHLSQLLERAHAGEEIVIAKNGKPFARLTALAPPEPRQPGLLKGDLEGDLFAPLPEEELAAWEG